MMKNFTSKAMFMAVTMAMTVATAWADELSTPVYFNNFSATEGLTVAGNGVFEEDADARFGQVFHNDPTLTKAMRTNYLVLPDDVLSHSTETKEMTIAFWVNVKEAADYWFSPIFSAYGQSPAANAAAGNAGNENNWPVFVLQSRGLMQINNGGWCDFGVNLNDNSEQAENTYWLDDKAWHLYTVTLTTTKAIIYIDGKVFNSWTLDGSEGQVTEGFFTYGGNYKHICLGGNQAWNWSDPDPAYAFDDFAVYDKALTTEQIKTIIDKKMTTSTAIQTVGATTGTAVRYNLAGQQVGAAHKGIVIENGRKMVVK